MKKYVRVTGRRILEIYMTIKDISFSDTNDSAEMRKIGKMVDNLLLWMAEYCGRRSFNPFHKIDAFIMQRWGIKLKADHWLADPQKLGVCISNPHLFIVNK